MALRKCCVGMCDSTNQTHRLFNLPKNDELRDLWLSFLIPTNVELSGLSKEQLIAKRVCHKHFDRYQFDSTGNRLRNGYPSLFTPKEISYGIALSPSVGDHLSDHNYFSQIVPEESIEALATIVVEGDHMYGKPLEFQVPNTSEIVPENIIPATEAKLTAKKRKDLSKCTCFIKSMKQKAISLSKTGNSFGERLAEARNMAQNPLFLNNFSKMSKKVQNFMMMQLRSVDKKKKAMRFTNDEKLLSLTLMKESPKGYRLLQKIFKLPTKRTLNRLAETITFKVGINENIFRLIRRKALKWDIKKKICSIVFDEVALTPHLTYVESKDEIKGFKDLGVIKQLTYSDHALVFMLRGVCSNWKQPICYYFCEGTTSSAEVKRILKEVVEKVSESGLIPVALVCDQGTTFRSAIKMFRQETEQKRHLNGEHNDGTIEVSGQCLSVVYDPPHLLKGIRNNFLTKKNIYKGKIATWEDILTVYNTDCQLGHTRMNKKLTEHHVIAERIKKMKVSVAAQVLSQQTSAMLKYTSLFTTTVTGQRVSETMGTTGEVVEFFDKLFDSVNGSKTSATKGKLRGPIKPKSEHFSFWQEARNTLKSLKFVDSTSKKAIKNKQEYYVRVPSSDGWITTLESFERIAKLLFDTYNLSYFYPRNINQDPLENFFGRIRAINYRNVNPDCYTFINSFKSLLISNVMGPHSLYSNCEEDDCQTIVDFYNLLQEDHDTDDDKENVPVDMNSTFSFSSNQAEQSSMSTPITIAINERVRVHSSAYTAGYLCRRVTKKFNCKNCKVTYTAHKKENIHEWIAHREYKSLKNSNLAYPSEKFLILYRNISDYIHSSLNKLAHKKNVGECIRLGILSTFDINWLGCTSHKVQAIHYFLKLILRIHIHNWCNIINKILKGDVEEKYVRKMNLPQIMAYNKYKTHRLRNKKK